jgi:hypothetical protein
MDPDHLGRHSRRCNPASNFVLEGSLLKPGQGGVTLQVRVTFGRLQANRVGIYKKPGSKATLITVAWMARKVFSGQSMYQTGTLLDRYLNPTS